ncbi:MAG: endo-1,4-beta-xylanase, partial [Sedimentisphaerales bacterium]
ANDPNTVPGAMAPSAQNVRFSLAGFGGNAGAEGDTGARRGAGGGRGARGGFGGGFGGFGGRGGGTPPTPEILQQQADVYSKLFQIFNKYSDTVSRVTFWGISDNRTWRRGQNPLLFDGQLQPKPAFQAVLDVAQGK